MKESWPQFVAVLMVGGEHSTRCDSKRAAGASVSKPPELSALPAATGREKFAVDNAFALIDGYIYADCSSPNHSLQSRSGPYISVSYASDCTTTMLRKFLRFPDFAVDSTWAHIMALLVCVMLKVPVWLMHFNGQRFFHSGCGLCACLRCRRWTTLLQLQNPRGTGQTRGRSTQSSRLWPGCGPIRSGRRSRALR